VKFNQANHSSKRNIIPRLCGDVHLVAACLLFVINHKAELNSILNQLLNFGNFAKISIYEVQSLLFYCNIYHIWYTIIAVQSPVDVRWINAGVVVIRAESMSVFSINLKVGIGF